MVDNPLSSKKQNKSRQKAEKTLITEQKKKPRIANVPLDKKRKTK